MFVAFVCLVMFRIEISCFQDVVDICDFAALGFSCFFASQDAFQVFRVLQVEFRFEPRPCGE